MGRPFTVLVSSAGRRVELLRGFRRALGDLGLDGRVLAIDRSWWSSAFHDADEAALVPDCDDRAFVPAVAELCEKHAVDLVVPTIDPELPVYAAARDRLAAAGTTVAVSSPEAVALAADKRATHRWLVAHGLPTVAQGTPADVAADHQAWPFPLVVKPRRGSAGIGVAVVHDADELALAARHSGGVVVVEALAPGDEHTIDVLVDRGGRCVCAVPRRRIEVRGGEVSKGVTVRSPALEALAAEVVAALPGAYGPLTVQAFTVAGEPERSVVIEVNARFGGGFPLALEAGADYCRWLVEEVAGLPSTARADRWRDGVVMLRYDAAVFVEGGGERASGGGGEPEGEREGEGGGPP
jgi:carbamoyl-phosphate synthase large subunit